MWKRHRYAYDAEGQLTQASYRAFLGPEPELTPSDAKRSDSFQYDALGNRYGSNRIASRGIYLDFTRRNNGLNQYLMWSPYSAIYHDDNWFSPWVWPGNGMMMADGYITASYNALNQPMAMGSQGLGSNFYWFWHDPLGRCVKRWLGNGSGVPTGAISYLYYDGWSLVQEGPNASTADRLYVHGGRVDEIVASKIGGQWYNHQYDARGHCLLLTNRGGAIQEQYDYDAFGMPYIYNAAGASLGNSGGVGNRFLFTGREWLKDLRVYDYRHRHYQPELGRFLQPDPIQFKAGDYNLYRYCHNDPVNKSDPFGEKWDVPDSIRADFDAARAYLSADPRMKEIFDRIDAAPNNIRVVPTGSLMPNADQFQGTDQGNGWFEWNPRAGALFPNGQKQSPAMVLGHEAAHPERFIRDPKGYISDVSPAAGHYTYGNREERRVIETIETPAAKRLREGVRSSAKARFYETDGVTSRKKEMKILSLVAFFTLAGVTVADVPRDLVSDLRGGRWQKVFPTRESMPLQLKSVLKKTFKQQAFAMANPQEPIRESSFVVGGTQDVPPTRRLIIAFETLNYFIVYYQGAGYQSGATCLAFRKQPKPALVWGGVSFKHNASATPAWVAQQIIRGKFLDDDPFIW